MLRVAHKLNTRLDDYRLGTWEPVAGLASRPRRLRPRWNKAFLIDSGLFLPVVLWVGALLTLTESSGWTAWAKFIVVPCAAISLLLAAVALVKETTVLRLGVLAQGRIVGRADDGIDRLFTIYYEDGEVPFQASIIAKTHPPAGKWHTGDSVSVILAPQRSGDMQKFVLYPSPSYEVLS